MPNPLPESVLSGDPCEALTRQQVKEALGNGGTQDREGEDPVGPYCRWSDPATGGGVTVSFSVKTRQGLSAYYANTKPQMPIFRDAGLIAEFPAVEYQTSEDDILCSVAVGLGDQYAVDVAVTLSRRNMGKVDSCEPAKTIATWTVENLKSKAGK